MQVEPFSVNFLSVTKKKSSFSNSLSVTFVETNEDPFSRSEDNLDIQGSS